MLQTLKLKSLSHKENMAHMLPLWWCESVWLSEILIEFYFNSFSEQHVWQQLTLFGHCKNFVILIHLADKMSGNSWLYLNIKRILLDIV